MDISNFNKIDFSDIPAHCFATEEAKKIGGTLYYASDINLEHITQYLKIEVIGFDASGFKNNTLIFGSPIIVHVQYSGSNNHIEFGENSSGIWVFRTWLNDSTIKIGNGVTSNGTDCFINPGSRLEVGNDCMFSLCHVLVGDSHAMFDIEEKKIINEVENPTVIIGEHVWVGLHANVSSGTKIGKGSIVATRTVTKGEYPECSLIAGIPGKVKRTGVSWTRNYRGEGMQAVIDELKTN